MPAVVLVAVGAVALLLGFLALDFVDAGGLGSITFRDLRDFADLADLGGLSGAWYSWLAFTLMGLAIIAGGVSLIPSAMQSGLRILGAALSGVGIAVAFLALSGKNGIDFGDRSVGFGVAMVGYALIAAGCLVPFISGTKSVPGSGTPTSQSGFANQYPPAAQPYSGQAYGAGQPAAVPPPATPAWSATPVPPPPAPAQPTIPAGWHPDPSGRNDQRWWDGQTWTAYAMRAGAQVNDPI